VRSSWRPSSRRISIPRGWTAHPMASPWQEFKGKAKLVIYTFFAALIFIAIVKLELSQVPHFRARPSQTPAPTSPTAHTGVRTGAEISGSGSGTGAVPGEITYIVTGSPAEIAYGPAGNAYVASTPLDTQEFIRKPGGRPAEGTPGPAYPAYYYISAQLSAGGSITCAILVGQRVVDQESAHGGHAIAKCEVGHLDGRWTSFMGS
jgi:hypothetical protein